MPAKSRSQMSKLMAELDVDEMVDVRRAWFVADASRLAAIISGAPHVPPPWNQRPEEVRDRFVESVKRQCGEDGAKSGEDAHERWIQMYREMGWTWGETYDQEKKTHPDLVSHAALDQKERDKDEVFIALCEIAKRYIREDSDASEEPGTGEETGRALSAREDQQGHA